jgi:glycosyltransferase involved in cell wall biosynthesis
MRKLAIIPAYNEQGSIAQVVSDVRRAAPDFDVLVVDDGSTDHTAARAEETGAAVMQHPFNLGIGGTVQSGYKYAVRHDYDVAVQVDGDGQHDPAYLGAMLARLTSEGVDLVSGSRFLESAGYKVPLRRRTGIAFFALVLSRIVGQRITDPTSGFRMAGRRTIKLFAGTYPVDYPEVEAILMMHTHDLQMREVPVRMRERASGHSSITNTLSAYYMVKVLLAVVVGLFRRRPAPSAGTASPVSAERGI